jgi:hypothetical protein
VPSEIPKEFLARATAVTAKRAETVISAVSVSQTYTITPPAPERIGQLLLGYENQGAVVKAVVQVLERYI